SSAVRIAPPSQSLRSSTHTRQPPLASSAPQASELTPLPTMTASNSGTPHPRPRRPSPFLGREVGDRLREGPAVAAGVFDRVLALAVLVVRRRAEDAPAPEKSASMVPVDVVDADHHRVRTARTVDGAVDDDHRTGADEQLRAVSLRLPALDEPEGVAEPVHRRPDLRIDEDGHDRARRHCPVVHRLPSTSARNSSSVTSPRFRVPRSFTFASTSARRFSGMSNPSSSAFRRMESRPLFFPSTSPRSAATSADEYGSIEGGSWNWLATAPDSRRKRVSPVTGFHGASP